MNHQESRDRVLKAVMNEIRHLPPPRQPISAEVWAVVAILTFYAACMVLMAVYHTTVTGFWQWMIATIWVEGLETTVMQGWLLLDGAMLAALIVGIGIWARVRMTRKYR